MPSQYEILPGEPILLQIMDEAFDYRTDMPRDLVQITSILDQQSTPVFYIIDMGQISLGLDDLIAAAGGASEQAQLFRHPKMREAIVITKSRMMSLAAKGMNSPVFGGIKFKVFGTREEALAYARGSDTAPSTG